MSAPASNASKAQWRDWASSVRSGLDWSALSAATVEGLEKWDRLQHASRVLLYLPMANEIDIRSIMDRDLGCTWLTTRTPDSGTMLTVHELGGPLEVHQFGYLQPHRSAPQVDPLDIDLVLAPGLAFDLWGNRLGHGAGYYDRLLSATRHDAPRVGVVPVAVVVDRLPREVHDVPMTHLATEEGVIESAGGGR